MSLFKDIVKDLSNADIGWMNDKASFYEYGYLLAAEKISVDYEKLHVQEKDSLIFPIIFLYRQHIELSLKGIIRELDLKLKFNRKDKILDRHHLLDLWDASDKCYNDFIQINSISLVFTNSSTAKERGIVKEFNNIDNQSFSFRYPTNISGNKNLQDLTYISLNNFQTEISLVVDHIKKMIETLAHTDDL